MIDGQSCKNCLYSSEMTNIGTCHRQSPTRDRDDYVGNARWPEVWDHNWCGEWKPDASIAGQIQFGALDERGRVREKIMLPSLGSVPDPPPLVTDEDLGTNPTHRMLKLLGKLHWRLSS